MTIKEQIVAKMQAAGHGFVESCEAADDCIKEFKHSGKDEQIFAIYPGPMKPLLRKGKCVEAFMLRRA